MPIDLTKPSPPIVLGSYPGMARAEAIVWERFIVSDENFFTGFIYNVPVGEIPTVPPNTEENFRRMWVQINQSRLDALGISDDELVVFEVKISAGLSAIGQAIGGRILTELDPGADRPIRAAIVTDGIRPDAVTIANVLGIQILQFPP